MGTLMEKTEIIRNPLTLLAIFAGLSEVAMTAVLPFLPTENQRIFMYFVMLYPSLLVCGFFYILIWKREALYAPSDFKDDATWLEVMRDKERKILEKYPVERAITSLSEKNDSDNRYENINLTEPNKFYEFLRSLGMTHENIKLIASSVENVDELPDFVASNTSLLTASEKIQRILNDFQSSRDDFYKLKSIIKEDIK